MGYYVTLDYEGAVKKIDETGLEQLNKLLEEGRWPTLQSLKLAWDQYGLWIETNDYVIKLNTEEIEDFANHLAEKVIKEGWFLIALKDDIEGTEGYYVLPGKVIPAKCMMVPEQVVEKVEKIIEEELR